MRRTVFILLFFLLSQQSQAQTSEWIAQPLSGSVTAYFPTQPGQNDTIGQTMYFLNDGKDLMLATVAPIPNTVTSQTNYQSDSVLNNFIASIIGNATKLIYSDIEFKGIPSKYYKVRVDESDNPIKGLIADSYNFVYKDTIYSFSYLRYDATELYNYNQQRMFFDMVEIKNYVDQSTSKPLIPSENPIANSTSKNSQSNTMNLIALAVALVGIVILIYRFQNRKGKGHFD